MPLYAYRCPDGHDTELQSPMKDRPQCVRCPCGKFAARRLAMPKVVFVGGFEAGWTRETTPYKVSWGDVEKHMKHCDQSRAQNYEKQIKTLSTFIADTI